MKNMSNRTFISPKKQYKMAQEPEVQVGTEAEEQNQNNDHENSS